MYTIISKIEYSGGVIYTPIGYTTDSTFINTINTDYQSSLGNWIETNKAALESGAVNTSEFFVDTPIVHSAMTTSSSVEGLTEITEL